MPPKRKSNVLEALNADAAVPASATNTVAPSNAGGRDHDSGGAEPVRKKQKKGAADDDDKHKSWRDVHLDGEGSDGGVPVYDDCNEIRRKIRALQKTPGFKVTHWLREIGNINSNSFGRFMSAKGPTGGAGNGTYYAAYVYFEKVRIAEGKKKTAKRLANEKEFPRGFELQERRYTWVYTGSR